MGSSFFNTFKKLELARISPGTFYLNFLGGAVLELAALQKVRFRVRSAAS